MKKMILLAGVAMLAACGGNDAAEEAATEDAAEDTAMMEDASADGPGQVGTYTVYNAEGELDGTAVHNADGTYSWTGADGETGEGTWQNMDGKLCMDAAEAEGEEDTGIYCYTMGETGADGRTMWTGDGEDGEVVYTEMVAG